MRHRLQIDICQREFFKGKCQNEIQSLIRARQVRFSWFFFLSSRRQVAMVCHRQPFIRRLFWRRSHFHFGIFAILRAFSHFTLILVGCVVVCIIEINDKQGIIFNTCTSKEHTKIVMRTEVEHTCSRFVCILKFCLSLFRFWCLFAVHAKSKQCEKCERARDVVLQINLGKYIVNDFYFYHYYYFFVRLCYYLLACLQICHHC